MRKKILIVGLMTSMVMSLCCSSLAQTTMTPEARAARAAAVKEQTRLMNEAMKNASGQMAEQVAKNAELLRLHRLTNQPVARPEPKPIVAKPPRVNRSHAPEGLGTHLLAIGQDHPYFLTNFTAEQLSKTNRPTAEQMRLHKVVTVDVK